MSVRRGGAGNFAENPERAAEAGRKGVAQAEEISGTVLNEPLKQAEKGGKSAGEALLAAGIHERSC